MKTSDFYYELPPELIAQTPLEKRDSSRLLCMDRKSGALEHTVFADLADRLEAGDPPAGQPRCCCCVTWAMAAGNA